MANLDQTAWKKSTRSNDSGDCVEIAQFPAATGVRDSKDATGPALTFTPADWRSFTTAAKAGQFDL